MPTAKLGNIAVIVCALALSAAPALGKDKDWDVKPDFVGKHDDPSEDISGIACTTRDGFPRSCLVIDDELQHAQFVELRDGKLVPGERIKLIDNKFKDKKLELDGEGVAFSKGFYYVIGSHGRPRNAAGMEPDLVEARTAASSQIVRFRVNDGSGAKVQPTSKLREIIAAEPALKDFVGPQLDDNGLTIEGIAIQDDATLFVGFRGPVLDHKTRAVVLSVPIDALFDAGAGLHTLFRLPLGEGRGVRDLASFEGGILILAGPMADKAGAYAIYAWDGKSENVRLLSELTQFDPKRKPEALLPLDKSGAKLRVLIMFDHDKNGAPTPVEIPTP